ncbi:MAG TPA: amidohydrolase [Vicinamibacterales bacterium]|nr:amidohydrolase [Vicinamibacterales bacterium]
MIRAGFSAALLFLAAAGAPAQQHADLIVVNARIWTGDAAAPEAEALAVSGERIIAIGTTAAIRAHAAATTRVIDAEGRRIVPGFNDAHWHLPSRRTADLADAGNPAEIQARLKAFARSLPASAWITGRGWKPTDFPGNQAHKRYLDEIFADRPVLITDRDGHQALANSRALSLASVTHATPDPANGRIDRDATGEATGLLKEDAASIVRRLLPAQTAGEIFAALLAEIDKAASFGLTSLQIASGTRPESLEFAAYRRLRDTNAMKARLRLSVPFARDITAPRLAEFAALAKTSDAWLAFGIAKGMLDGTVDAHTAAMIDPYANSTDLGIPMWPRDLLNHVTAAYDRGGLQIELHAIGDRAIRLALDAFEFAARANGTSGRRHRVEHVEVPALDDLPRFAALGVIASTQAIFALPDDTTLNNYAPALGPDRASRAVAFKLLDDAGAAQAFGSDYPVFPMDPLRGIHAAVTRETPDGTPKGGWYPEHRLTVERALRHYTYGSAFASFEEHQKGTLAAGRLADFVMLSHDILTGPPSTLLEAKVLLTVAGGRTTYQR